MSIVLPPYREPIVQIPSGPPADMPVQWRRWFEEMTRKISELETRLEALEP